MPIKMVSPAVVMWTNDVFHPRAWTYREGFRHCMVYIWSKDGWYGREFRPGQGEIIYPRVAEPDANLLLMLGGNHEPAAVDLDPDIAKRRANVLPAEVRVRHQRFFVWYRKKPVYHVKHYLGLRLPHIKKPEHLFNHLSPTEKSPKKPHPVTDITQAFIPPANIRSRI